MKVVCLAGSKFGNTTRIALDLVENLIRQRYPDYHTTLLDLADYEIEFSDGRIYQAYQGDTGFVARTIMEADVVIIATPIFQASIPGTLKNIFDLLPYNGFENKVVGIIALAGSPRHFLVIEHQLKSILNYMKAHVVRQYVFIEDADFDANRDITNQNVLLRIRNLVDDTMINLEVMQRLREARQNAQDK